ncbi:MAG: hypothetical protein ACYSUX_17510 [Planctomycetota bacterium]
MIKQKAIRIYADTSVFGGVFDAEFEEPSKAFFNAIRAVRFVLVSSELVRQEIPMYNAVNTLHGYREISIYSPMEVIEYED